MSSKVCPNCGFTADQTLKKCPQCGNALPSSVNWRVRGWLQLLCGLFLVGMLGTITFNLAPSLLQPGVALEDGSKFSGTSQQAVMILGLFGVLIMFGVSSMISGIYQIVTGRRNKWLFLIFIIITAVMLGIAGVTYKSLGG